MVSINGAVIIETLWFSSYSVCNMKDGKMPHEAVKQPE